MSRNPPWRSEDLRALSELLEGAQREVEDAERPASAPRRAGCPRHDRRSSSSSGARTPRWTTRPGGRSASPRGPRSPADATSWASAMEHHHVGVAAMSDLGLQARAGLANHEALGERAGAVRARHELGAGRHHSAELLRDRPQRLLEVARDRPPELVGVVVEDPVGAELAWPPACAMRVVQSVPFERRPLLAPAITCARPAST